MTLEAGQKTNDIIRSVTLTERGKQLRSSWGWAFRCSDIEMTKVVGCPTPFKRQLYKPIKSVMVISPQLESGRRRNGYV